MEQPYQYHVLLNRKGWCFCRQQDKVGKYEIRSGVSSTLGHARSKESKRLNWFLTRDRTRFTTLFGIVLLYLFSTVARVVPITAPRQGKNSLLETLFFCASGPCVHVETHVARTAATLRLTAFASLGCRKRKLSVLVTSAMPSCAAPNIWCLICDGHWAHIGTRRGRSTHAEQMKTSVRFQAVGV